MSCFAEETIKLLPSCDNVGGTCGVHEFRKIHEQAASFAWPLNLIAPPQTDDYRGIALSGFSAAPPSIIRLEGAVCIGSLP
jgi:hypothetical protein